MGAVDILVLPCLFLQSLAVSTSVVVEGCQADGVLLASVAFTCVGAVEHPLVAFCSTLSILPDSIKSIDVIRIHTEFFSKKNRIFLQNLNPNKKNQKP
jgi:hypothetical protein